MNAGTPPSAAHDLHGYSSTDLNRDLHHVPEEGIARTLLSTVGEYAMRHGCARMYLTSEPDNGVVHRT